MLIQVLTGGTAAEVVDVDDLKAFSVAVQRAATDADVTASLAGLGRLDGSHAWISIEALRAAVGRGDDADWQSNFDGMVGYAASKGWVSDDGGELRAHLDRDA